MRWKIDKNRYVFLYLLLIVGKVYLQIALLKHIYFYWVFFMEWNAKFDKISTLGKSTNVYWIFISYFLNPKKFLTVWRKPSGFNYKIMKIKLIEWHVKKKDKRTPYLTLKF